MAREKCSNCRQRLAEVKTFKPSGRSAGVVEVVKEPSINIAMDVEDGEALQYKLTDFIIYDNAEDSSIDGHLVPIFAESLLSRGVKLWLAGRVLRLDSEVTEVGLEVEGLGPITQWNNATGMEGGENNVIISIKHAGKELEFNLVRPHSSYLPLYQNTFRMVFMANNIIVKLIEVCTFSF